MNNRIGGIGLGLVLVAVGGNALASSDPQAIEMAGGKLIPTLNVIQKYDDNIFSQAFNEESDNITQLQPRAQWLQEKDADSYALTYTGDYGFYWDSDDDNYDDHTLSFDASLSPSDLYRVDFGASFARLHDNRGEGSSEGVNALLRDEPDEYNISNLHMEVDFGRESAMFGVRVIADQSDIEYKTNTDETKFRDRQETYFAGRFYGRLNKTKYFFEVSDASFTYDNDPIIGPGLDSDEQTYSIGAEWEATAKTTGEIKIGQFDKEFDSDVRGDEDFTFWDVDVTWSPRTYSRVHLSASKDANETNGTGSFIEAQNITLSWLHAWSDRLSSTISIAMGEDDYFKSLREDDRESFSLGLNYDFRRWLTIGANYAYQERDSNQNIFDYEKNVFTVNFDMSM